MTDHRERWPDGSSGRHVVACHDILRPAKTCTGTSTSTHQYDPLLDIEGVVHPAVETADPFSRVENPAASEHAAAIAKQESPLSALDASEAEVKDLVVAGMASNGPRQRLLRVAKQQ